MTERPPPIGTVVVPETFSPSQLYTAARCRLRAVLSSGRMTVPRLPPHPFAERGTVFHELLGRAALGAIPRGPTDRDAVRHELVRILDEAARRLASIPSTAHFARLEAAFPPVEWHNATQDVLGVAERLLATTPPYDPSAALRNRQPLAYEQLGPEGKWSEVVIRAPRLRLSGRMDVVEKHRTGRVVIRDYKTGRVRDREGSLLEHIELQLRLYALAVREVDPGAQVELQVFDKNDRPISSDEVTLRETEEWLARVLDGLPPNVSVRAEELAAPGSACTYCSFRHVCPSYLRESPSLWKKRSEETPMPKDTWGEVLEIGRPSDGTLTIDLLDSVGRRVKIVRLGQRHEALRDVAAGVNLWFFGLEATQAKPVQGRYLHPRNFYELPTDPSQRRAWCLTLFLGGGARSY
jgi:RecB family exonuclease